MSPLNLHNLSCECLGRPAKVLPPPAVFTQTVYRHAMGFRLKLVSFAHLILQTLYGLVSKLDYFAATGADEVVVMFVCVDVFVVRMLLPEDDLSEVPALYQQ